MDDGIGANRGRKISKTKNKLSIHRKAQSKITKTEGGGDLKKKGLKKCVYA